MRKITWIILLLIALIWLAIARFWTGSEKPEKTYDFPESTLTLTPTPTEPPLASPSAEATPTVTTPPSGGATPTIGF